MIAEDGTGLANSNSYASVAEADAYLLLRGVASWDDVDEKEAALIRATGAIDGMYSSRWPGSRSNQDQALAWPRTGAWDIDGFPLVGVPTSVKVATIEGALIEAVTPGALAPSLDRGGAIIREKVGPIETEYAAGASAVTIYSTIRNALSRIVPSGGGMVFKRG